MEMISQERQSQSIFQHKLILSRLKHALDLISTHVDLLEIEGNSIHYLVLLNEKKKAQYKIWTRWKITVDQFIQIQVVMSNQHQQFLPPDPSIIITDLMVRLNRESIMGNYFTFSQNPTLLCFRYSFSADIHKKCLGATIAELFLEVSEQFAKWVTKLKMVGGDDKIKSDKMYNCLRKMRYLKQFFECQRLNRPKSTKNYNLKHSQIKIVQEATRIAGYQPSLLNNYRNNQMDRTVNMFQIFKAEYEKILKQLTQKEIESVHDTIMRGIQIKKTINQKKFDQGGFSQIYKGQYIVGVTTTINTYVPPKHLIIAPNRNNEVSIEDCDEDEVDKFSRKQLVKKVMKKSIKQVDSFKNQINLLIYLRNDKQERIAGYYIQKDNQNQNLFIELYEKNLLVACQNWTEKILLNATKQLLQGLAYLSSRKILHRDLKQLNILIDRQNHIKIIDFGSACAVYEQNRAPGSYVAISNNLLSTPNYYFPYGVISNQYPGIKKKFTKQQYEQAANFDIFSFGKVVRNLFNLWRGIDNIFYRQLNYLADKCQEKNPQDRLTAKEAQCYIYLISEIHRLQNEQSRKIILKSPIENQEKPCQQVSKQE